MPRAPRNLLACQQCRNRKVRCDGARPRCNVCSQRSQACHWPDRLAPGNYKFVVVGDATSDENRQNRSMASPQAQQRRRPDDGRHGHGAGQGHDSDGERHTDERPADDPLSPLLKHRLLQIFSQTHLMLELCGCIDIDMLKGDVAAGKDTFLLQSILALSSLYLTDVEAASDSSFTSSKSFMSFYRSSAQASSRMLSDAPSAVAIQANLVLGLCELLTMATSKAWLHIGLAIRMAQTLRMRREYNRRLIPRQREVRRRTFWACVVLDRLVAYCTFRTQTIELSLVELHLPCSDVAFAFGHDSPGPKIHDLGRGNSVMAVEKMTLAYFVKTFLLWSPIARVYVDGGRRVQHSRRRQPAVSSLEYEAAMAAWRESLPDEMQWSERNLYAHKSLGQVSHFASMHLLIQHAIFLAHHEHLPHAEETDLLQVTSTNTLGTATALNESEAAVTICLEGANKVITMLRLMDSVMAGLAHTPLGVCAGIPIVTTASILLWVYHCSKKAPVLVRLLDEVAQAKSDLDFLLTVLDSWAKKWALARAWANCIRLLDDFYQSKYGSNNLDSNSWPLGANSNNERATTLRADVESGPASPTPLRDGDGFPDLTMIPQDTYYKVRLITGLIIEQPELCKQFLQMSTENQREPEQQVDLWESDLDFSWMDDPDSIMAASALWTEFPL